MKWIGMFLMLSSISAFGAGLGDISYINSSVCDATNRGTNAAMCGTSTYMEAQKTWSPDSSGNLAKSISTDTTATTDTSTTFTKDTSVLEASASTYEATKEASTFEATKEATVESTATTYEATAETSKLAF